MSFKIKKTEEKKKIVVAMSGGVDSSVTAALLKKAGFEVVGIFMKFWTPSSSPNKCCSPESEVRAREVANILKIPFYVFNFEKEFKNLIVDYFLKEYKSGRTPNPCVICNKEIKFGLLLRKALSLKADFVATGHYARIKKRGNFYNLLMGKDRKKDQSYFLWGLNQEQLKHILLPLGDYRKEEVRRIAKKLKLPSADSPESQEICFVENTINDFLKNHLKNNPGRIIDTKGEVLGEHQGLWFYTIGQRRGLNIPQGPWFVIEKDAKKNVLIVSQNQKDLLKKELFVGDVNWILPVKLPLEAKVKIRYKSNFVKAKIFKIKNSKLLKVVFQKAQRAVTPGQSAVFYKGQVLLGGGIIKK